MRSSTFHKLSVSSFLFMVKVMQSHKCSLQFPRDKLTYGAQVMFTCSYVLQIADTSANNVYFITSDIIIDSK